MIILSLKILLCLSFLLYASYTDVKYRIVKNKVWIVFFPLIIPFIIFDLATKTTTISTYLMPFVLTSVVMIIAVYQEYITHLVIIGEADAKLFILLSLLFPTYPLITYLSTPSIFTFGLFGNSLLFTTIWFLCLGFYSKISRAYKLPKDLPFMVSILVAFPITLIVGDVLGFILSYGG